VNGVTLKSPTGFTVFSPLIYAVSPNYGAPSALVNITGENFGVTQGTSSVTVGGAPSYVVSWSDIQIRIEVPTAGVTGNIRVMLGGGAVSNGVPFTHYPYPEIASLSTTSGSADTPVTITGSNLLDGGNNATVTFNGVPAPVSTDTTGSIQLTVPSGATSGRVLVRVNGVTLVAATDFIVTPSP